MMTSEPPASEWKREESWEDILENMNNAASLKLKGTVKSGGEEACLFVCFTYFIIRSRKGLGRV